MSAELVHLSEQAKAAGNWESSENLRAQAAELALAELKAQAELGGPDAERIKLGLKVYDFSRKHANYPYDIADELGLIRTKIRCAGRPVASIEDRVFEFVEVIFIDGDERDAGKARRFTRRVGPFTLIASVNALGIYVDPFEAERPFGSVVALRRIKETGGYGYHFSTGKEIPAEQHVAEVAARKVFKRA